MDIQEKRPVSVRLDPELVAWAEEYGRSMRWDRTTVITAALESFREDVAGGVPDPAKQRVVRQPAERRVVKPESPASGVVRGSDVRAVEPNVDRFAHTDDYRRAMALFRAREPWQQLMKNPKQEEGL
jgi:hypothetical protein